MQNRKQQIPWAMAAGRAVLGPVLVAGERAGWNGLAMAWVVLSALMSDIFDGVLARRWHCDTAGVRLFDSMADTAFYVCVAVALWLGQPQMLRANAGLLAALLALEVARFGVDFAKFGKPASYHSWLAKAWGLAMAVAVIAAFLSPHAGWLLAASLILGIACNLEGVTISLVLPIWRKDVKGLRAAMRLRREMLGAAGKARGNRWWVQPARKAAIAAALTFCVAMARAQTHDQTPVRRTLAQTTEIQGCECAKGYAWFYTDGRLKECAVARDTDFGVARVPTGSIIDLTGDGRPSGVFLKRDTEIAGYLCEGGNRLLGPSEGAATGLYPSGKLKVCWLAEARDVQGVPCAGSGMFTGDSSVRFYESGKLQACKLSKDYGTGKRGQLFSQAQ